MDQPQLINCRLDNNGRNGVQGNPHGAVIRGGSISGNYWRLNTDASQAGIKIMGNDPSYYLTIDGVEIARNHGKGIWFDSNYTTAVTSIVSTCNIHDNLEQGIDLEASKNIIVINCDITGNGDSGIFNNATSNCSITGNRLSGNHGIAQIELDGGQRMFGAVSVGTFDVSITHNTIGTGASKYAICLPMGGDPRYMGRITSDGNVFTPDAILCSGGTYLGKFEPMTLDEWRVKTGQDLNSTVK